MLSQKIQGFDPHLNKPTGCPQRLGLLQRRLRTVRFTQSHGQLPHLDQSGQQGRRIPGFPQEDGGLLQEFESAPTILPHAEKNALGEEGVTGVEGAVHESGQGAHPSLDAVEPPIGNGNADQQNGIGGGAGQGGQCQVQRLRGLSRPHQGIDLDLYIPGERWRLHRQGARDQKGQQQGHEHTPRVDYSIGVAAGPVNARPPPRLSGELSLSRCDHPRKGRSGELSPRRSWEDSS